MQSTITSASQVNEPVSDIVKEYHETFAQNINKELDISYVNNISANGGVDGTHNLAENTFSSVSKEIRLKNADRLIIVHLNRNSIINKFEALSSFVTDSMLSKQHDTIC